jgi:hypothetical protein
MIGFDRAGARDRRSGDQPAAVAVLGGSRRPAVVAAAIALALAVAGPAAAASLSSSQACYVNVNPAIGAPMTISGSGFGPGDSIELSGGTVSGSATADATGAFSITTEAPTLATAGPAATSTLLTVTDTNDSTGAQTTQTISVMSANLAVSTKPGSVKDLRQDRVTFRFSGFPSGKRIYAYYLRKGKVVAHQKFGRTAGPCGTLSEKALLFPGGHPTHSAYDVSFESDSTYSKNVLPRVTATLQIFTF